MYPLQWSNFSGDQMPAIRQLFPILCIKLQPNSTGLYLRMHLEWFPVYFIILLKGNQKPLTLLA